MVAFGLYQPSEQAAELGLRGGAAPRLPKHACLSAALLARRGRSPEGVQVCSVGITDAIGYLVYHQISKGVRHGARCLLCAAKMRGKPVGELKLQCVELRVVRSGRALALPASQRSWD